MTREPEGKTQPLPGLAERLNALSVEEARSVLEDCCAARRWVDGMLAARPYVAQGRLPPDGRVKQLAEAVWWSLAVEDWREALAAHPRIGDLDSLRSRFASTRSWAQGEQSGISGASETTLRELATANRAYEERFHHLFIVCASGKGAQEMLALLRQRLRNDAETEMRIAAREQLQITLLRLEKLATRLARGPE